MKKIDWDKFYDDFDKKIKIHIQKPKYDNDLKELLKVLKQTNQSFGNLKTHNRKPDWSSSITHAKSYYSNENLLKQFCIPKFRYGVSKQVHQKYLEEYIVQKDKLYVWDKPELFGNVSKDEYKKTMDKNCYKWILSPERNLNEEQLKILTKAFVDKTEQYLGKKLNWQAAVHKDTEHHHVHLLINGKDQNGKKFRFPKNFIRKEAHSITSELLTDMLGNRTPEEIRLSKDRQIYSERFTKLDKTIFNFQQKNTEQDVEISSYPTYMVTEEERLRRRLEFLQDIKLCKFRNNKWYLEENWDNTLRVSGKYNTFNKARIDYKKSDRKLKLYKDDIGLISGKVTRYYNMNDEDIWNNAIIVDDKNEKISWYVPLYNEGDKYLNSNIELNISINQKGLLVPKIKVVKKAEETGRKIETSRNDIPEIEKKKDNNIEY